MTEVAEVPAGLMYPGKSGALGVFAREIEAVGLSLQRFAEQWARGLELAGEWCGDGGEGVRKHLDAVRRYVAQQAVTAEYLHRAVLVFAEELLSMQQAAAALDAEAQALSASLGATVLPPFMAEYSSRRVRHHLRHQRLAHRAELLAQAFDRAVGACPPVGDLEAYPQWVAHGHQQRFDSAQDQALLRPAAVTDVLDLRPGKTDVTWEQVPMISGWHGDSGAQGTGIVVGRHEVLTNAHVVAGLSSIEVGEERLPAEVVVYDKYHDVAVLKVPGLTVAPVGFADSMIVDEEVIMAGHPLSQQGIDQGWSHPMGPQVTTTDDGVSLEFDAMVIKSGDGDRLTHGVSGGAVITSDGRLAGEINTEAFLVDDVHGGSIAYADGHSIDTLRPFIDRGVAATTPVPHGVFVEPTNDSSNAPAALNDGADELDEVDILQPYIGEAIRATRPATPGQD